MLMSPITPSSSAIRSVVWRISSSISWPRLIGGITPAEAAGSADRLRDERDRPGGARVRLDHVELARGDGVLDVDEPDHAELERDPLRGVADLLEHLLAQAHRRDHARRVAGVHPRLLDVLH